MLTLWSAATPTLWKIPFIVCPIKPAITYLILMPVIMIVQNGTSMTSNSTYNSFWRPKMDLQSSCSACECPVLAYHFSTHHTFSSFPSHDSQLITEGDYQKSTRRALVRKIRRPKWVHQVEHLFSWWPTERSCCQPECRAGGRSYHHLCHFNWVFPQICKT